MRQDSRDSAYALPNRRDFVRWSGAAAGAAAAGMLVPGRGRAAPTPASLAETHVAELYASLSEAQRKAICLPFDHESRGRIDANWHVSQVTVGDDLFSDAQRDLVERIVRAATSEEGYERFVRQMEDDDGGIQNYSMALFGDPASGAFQWELTGRHLTLRADGNSVPGAAFGGPLVYGHGEETARQNLFHYQTRQANAVFAALDGRQAERALVPHPPAETDVRLQGPEAQFPGIRVADLASDQKQLVEQTLKVLLAPYRPEDVDEAMAVLQQRGGADQLHMAFYQHGDLDGDRLWDMWRVEGPGFVWHFRGAPHVHAYIHVGLD